MNISLLPLHRAEGAWFSLGEVPQFLAPINRRAALYCLSLPPKEWLWLTQRPKLLAVSMDYRN